MLGAEQRGGFLRLRVGYDPGRGALRPGGLHGRQRGLSDDDRGRRALFHLRPHGRNPAAHDHRGTACRRPVNLERPGDGPATGSAATWCSGTSTRSGASAVRPDTAGRELLVAAPAGIMGLLVPKGSVAVDGVSLTRRGRARRLLALPDPRDARPDQARDARGSATRSTSRPTWHGETHRSAAGRRGARRAGAAPKSSGAEHGFGRTRGQKARWRSRSDRGHPPREDGDPRRRRGPRERGRPDDGRREGDAGGHQLHGHARARADLPDARGAEGPRPRACR